MSEIRGTVTSATIVGRVSPRETVKAQVRAGETIKAQVRARGSIGAQVRTRESITAQMRTKESVRAQVTASDFVVAEQPYYIGEYNVTPTEEEQVLSTQGMAMARNVVVGAIPSNYGRITWNGTTLTVS